MVHASTEATRRRGASHHHPMPHYVSLMRWTSTGVAGLPAWRDRIEEGERIIGEAAALSACTSLLGRYDMVEIFEAPDDETAARDHPEAAAPRRRAARRALRAFTRDEAEEIIRKL